MDIDLHESLKRHFGFTQFRPGQEQTICQLLDGHSSLAIFPTGSGKSLCYQLAALHLDHLTLVISPLLALIKDQLDFLANQGVAAASIDSTLTTEQSRTVMSDVRAGKIKILMVSVERFKNERFRQFIDAIPVSMLVVDEAHCISEWGHNFRPDYLKIPTYRQALKIPLVLLLTATATKKVKIDMADKFTITDQHIVQTGFYRNNLDLAVEPVSAGSKQAKLLSLIQQQSGAGIVYVTLQQSAEQVADFLSQNQINAQPYHAGFASEKRQQVQADFMAGSVQVVVATIAFGMGIDKADIRFVIHYDLPKSIENYSQEIGRAGRDGLPSSCTTLANLDGVNVLENFVYGDTPERAGIEHVLNTISRETKFDNSRAGQWELQEVGLSNASNIRLLPLKTLLVQLELLNVLQPMYSYYADFRYKFLSPVEDILTGFEGERRDFLEEIFRHTQFKKVWGSLNFESLLQSYHCDRARVVSALDYLHEKNQIELDTKRITLVFRVNQKNLDELTLVDTLYDYFVSREVSEIKRIAALVRFFELDHCLSNRLSLYFDDHQAPETCGHCSVCRGKIAKLNYSQTRQMPDDVELVAILTGLKKHLSATLSRDCYSRFLAGVSVPLFSRSKVRGLQGFALCEQLRYQDIRDKVTSLLPQIEV